VEVFKFAFVAAEYKVSYFSCKLLLIVNYFHAWTNSIKCEVSVDVSGPYDQIERTIFFA
jgi:hypothetical protein